MKFCVVIAVNTICTISCLMSGVVSQSTVDHDDLFAPVSNVDPKTIFSDIKHPFEPVYANLDNGKTVPTNSWISNLFYPSADNLAPTTPDPYTLRLLDGYGGNPGLTIRQPSTKVYHWNV